MARKKLWWTVGAVAIAVASVSVASGAASDNAARAVPPSIVGSWTRTFTAEQWKKAGAPDMEPFVGPYTLVVLRSGHAEVASIIAKMTARPGGLLTIGNLMNCPPGPGLYRWKVAARRLTLTKIHDSCPEEVGLFVGVWKKS